MWMPQITFQVKVLTPLFLAGADQTQAELRAPTFRGLMRYWYRALAGGVVGTNSAGFQQVMAYEKETFGATDTGSPVAVRVSNSSTSPRSHQKEGNTRKTATGKDYLLWSLAENNHRPARLFFPQNATFQVTLSDRGSNTTTLQSSIASFWLLTHLGGVGSRSRRCAGSLSATIAKTDVAIPKGMRFDIPTSIPDLKNQLSDGIKAAQGLIHGTTALSSGLAPFDTISPNTCSIWIVQDKVRPWNSVDEALRTLGDDLQYYRGGIDLQERRVFGLPLKDVSNKRRASPLLLRITELQGNKFVCVAVIFKTVAYDITAKDYVLVEDWASKYPGSVKVI